MFGLYFDKSAKYSASKTSKEELIDIARTIRNKYMANQDSSIFPIIDVIEKMHLDEMINLLICEDGKLEKYDSLAVYYLNTNTIYISESMYNDANNGDARARFTLTHEFAHYILLYVLHKGLKEVNRRILAFENPEWQANFLASEILVPSDEIIGLCVHDYNYVMLKYNVSSAVAELVLKRAEIRRDIIINPYSMYKKRFWRSIDKYFFPASDCVCMIKYKNTKNGEVITAPAEYHKDDKRFMIIDQNEYSETYVSESGIIKYAFVSPLLEKGDAKRELIAKEKH